MESELKKAIKEKKDVENENKILKEKLENCQRYIKSIISKPTALNKANHNINKVQNEEKTKYSNKFDGSSLMFQQRENGKFGSYPSFDNYDDDYNEKFDPQNDLLT